MKMLFDGIPDSKRQRFNSFVIEQPLGSSSINTIGGYDKKREGVQSSIGHCEHHESDLRKALLNRWKQNYCCDLGVFVRCSASEKDFMDEFRGLPVTYYADGLALVKMHGVVAAMSPLLAQLQHMARKKQLSKVSSVERKKRRRTEEDTNSEPSGAGNPEHGSPGSKCGTPPPTVSGGGSTRSLPEGTSFSIPNVESRTGGNGLNEDGMVCFSLDISVIEGCAFIRAANYLYTGSLRLCDVTISETLRACRYLGLQGAIDLCVKYLLQKLQPCNALSICALGNLFNCGTLEEMADEYLSDHFMEVTNDVEWGELASDAVQRLLSRDNLKCDSEASVVRALYRWASYNRSSDSASNPSSKANKMDSVNSSGDKLVTTSSNLSSIPETVAMETDETAVEEVSLNKSPAFSASQNEQKTTSAATPEEDKKTPNNQDDGDGDDDDDEDEDDDDDDEDEDEDEDQENRAEAFLKMLADGSIRFAHLSNDEIDMLTEEIQQVNGILYTLWCNALEKETAQRKKQQEKVTRTMQRDDKMANNDCDDNDDNDDEEDEEEDGTVPNLRRYNMAGGCQVEGASCVATLEGHGGYVYAVTELSDGNLVSGSRDLTIRVWDMKKNEIESFDRGDSQGPQPLILEGHSDRIFGLVALSNGKLASCSFDQTICIWNTTTWVCERILSGHEGWVVAIAECSGKLVSGAADNKVMVWNIETWEREKTLEGHTDHVYGVCRLIDPESSRPLLATGSQDSTVKIWDPLDDWKELRTLRGHKGSIRSIKQCGRYLASASADRTIRLWMCTGKSIGKPAGKLIGHSDVVESLASILQPGSHPVLASASRDNSIKLWNTLNKCCIRTLVGHRNWVKSLYYMSNGRLASASADGTVRVWDFR